MRRISVFDKLLRFAIAAVLFSTVFPVFSNAEEEWNFYFGQLHGHSGSVDTIGDPAEVFGAVKGEMDFFGLTDYSHSFDNAENGSLSDSSVESAAWAKGRQAAADASDETFAGFYGFEMGNKANPDMDHIATFATPGWQSWGQTGFSDVTDYLDTLVTVPSSIGMFCHPDPVHGDFAYFQEYRWDYDNHMPLLEVIGEYGETFYSAYQTALDEGWHVAPAANGASHHGNWEDSSVRTVILADELTEDSLFSAIRARRVYAATNSNLKITYRLGGHIMGSRVTSLENYQITLQLSQPEGNVHVITTEGKVLASQTAADNMTLEVASGYPYYYICMEKDGTVIAVTAPVWVEEPSNFGASELTASADLPIQGEEVTFFATLFNHETVPMTVDTMTLLADGETVWEAEEAVTLSPWESWSFSIPYTHPGVGVTEFSLAISGSIGGKDFTIEKELDLSYRPAVLNAHILVDGRHSSVVYEKLRNLTSLAAEADMDVAIFRDETPEGAKVMIVPAPERDFSENYPQLLKNFVESGGHLILCGTSGDNSRLNGLLESLGSTMRFYHDEATDPVHNGGLPGVLIPDVFNPDASCWEYLTDDQVYSQQFGCTLNPGDGIWLVKGKDTMEGEGTCLLAQEQLGTGYLTIAGSFFLDDEHMVLSRNPWDPPKANQTFLESVLDIQRIRLPISDIQDVRSGELGQVYRVTGYVTAGTSREYNRFPKMIYLQDGTGGIEITAFEVPDIQVGFSLDITGQLTMDGQNPALKLVSCRVIENDLYRHDPAVSPNALAMDYTLHGGELQKVEGTVETLEYTPDGLGIRRFTLRDEQGDLAEVLIEDYILSGADGVNHLAEQVMEGKAVRAYGILHRESDGNVVLRVRNCDEVVYIPPIPEKAEKGVPDLSNPNTGDPYSWFFTFLGL